MIKVIVSGSVICNLCHCCKISATLVNITQRCVGVTLAPVHAVGHQAEVGPYHAVEHGQLGGDPLHTLAHRDLSLQPDSPAGFKILIVTLRKNLQACIPDYLEDCEILEWWHCGTSRVLFNFCHLIEEYHSRLPWVRLNRLHNSFLPRSVKQSSFCLFLR